MKKKGRKAGRALDTDIAIKVMDERPLDITNIPHYSTDIFEAYKIISHFQTNNWNCNIKSKILTDGTLMYRVRFHKQKIVCEKVAPTIPIAICMVAIAIMDGQYIEYGDGEEDDDLHIPQKMPQIGVQKIDFTDETLLEILEKTIKEYDKENLSEKIVDILSKNGYFIVRQSPEDF